jgi:hypothetical protein
VAVAEEGEQADGEALEDQPDQGGREADGGRGHTADKVVQAGVVAELAGQLVVGQLGPEGTVEELGDLLGVARDGVAKGAELVDQQGAERDHEEDHPDDHSGEHGRVASPRRQPRPARTLAAGSSAKARNIEMTSMTSRLRSWTASQKAM